MLRPLDVRPVLGPHNDAERAVGRLDDVELQEAREVEHVGAVAGREEAKTIVVEELLRRRACD